MSALDELTALESNVKKRIAQLKPAHQEWVELMSVAQRLGIDPDAVDDQTAPNGTTTSRSGANRGAKSATRRRRPNARKSGAATQKPSRSTPAKAASKTSNAKARSSAARRTPGASRTGANRAAQIAELVRKRPGLTVAELGKELGVDPTGLYRPINKLQSEGQIRKNGAKLELVS